VLNNLKDSVYYIEKDSFVQDEIRNDLEELLSHEGIIPGNFDKFVRLFSTSYLF